MFERETKNHRYFRRNCVLEPGMAGIQLRRYGEAEYFGLRGNKRKIQHTVFLNRLSAMKLASLHTLDADGGV